MKAWQHISRMGLVPDRAELIRGAMIEKPAKSILHTKLASRILALLQKLSALGMWVRKEDPLTFADSEPEPDISVVEGSEEDFEKHPATARLVVEVSVSSIGEDRALADLYAEANVTEYWIVNGKDRCIEVYREPVEGRYRSQLRAGIGEALACTALPGVTVNVAELFSGIAAE